MEVKTCKKVVHKQFSFVMVEEVNSVVQVGITKASLYK